VTRAYLAQQAQVADIVEIVIMSCGSTDGTDATAARLAADSPRLRLVRRVERGGKLSAISAFAAQARGDVLVLAAADVLPAADAVDQLVAPFLDDANCGMTGPQVCPTTPALTPTARLHAGLWRLHHELALGAPKLGEVVAVRARHLRQGLPNGVHCDEVVLEARVCADGALLRYVPQAVVNNFAPAGLEELFQQRRRIACQHQAARRYLKYRPNSTRLPLMLAGIGRTLRRQPRAVGVITALVAVEALARGAGWLDFQLGRRYRTWTATARPTGQLQPADRR
jgi:glycosyltransferase involved in cell wall biosynthesis